MAGISLISSDSKRELLILIKRQETISLDDAEEATSLARTTIREHLSQLERDGHIERDTVKQGRGRPRLRYRLTNEGEALFPSQARRMLSRLIAFVQAEDQDDLLERFFAKYWEERLREVEYRLNRLPEDDTDGRLEELKQILDEQGFMPEIERSGDTTHVRECNCPFPEIVPETRLPCRLEAEFYEKVFDTVLERVSYIPDGHPACTYEISGSSAGTRTVT